MTIREALKAVVNECPDGYAKTYANAALTLGGSDDAEVVTEGNTIRVIPKVTGNMMRGEELKVQILYVLSNTTYWRGARAKEVKAVLKDYTKGM
jgi:hypothetical protein